MPFIGLVENPRTEQLFPRRRSSYIDIGFVQQDTFKTVVSSKYSNLLLESLEPFLVRQFRRCNLHRSHPERSSTLVCSSGLTVETVVSVLSTLTRLILLGTNLDGYTTLRSVKTLGCRRRRILDLATRDWRCLHLSVLLLFSQALLARETSQPLHQLAELLLLPSSPFRGHLLCSFAGLPVSSSPFRGCLLCSFAGLSLPLSLPVAAMLPAVARW